MKTSQHNIDFEIDNKFLIYGEEELIRLEILDNIRKKAKDNNFLNKTSFFVDSIDFDWSKIDFALKSKSLFAEKNFIEIQILNNKIGIKGQNYFINLSKSNLIDNNTLFVIVFSKLEKSQIKSKWFVSLSNLFNAFEARKIKPNELLNWVKARLNKYHLKIEEDALHLFVEKVEGNLLAANQEIEKLSLIQDPYKIINLEDVDKKVANVARHDLFEISNYWMRGDLAKSLSILNEIKASGEEPLLLWVLAEDIRTLLKLRFFLKQGSSIYDVKNKLRLWGDKAQNAQIALSRLSNTRLLDSLKKCSKIDMAIKGVYNKETSSELLQEIIINLAS